MIRALPLLPSEATLDCWGRGGEAEQARLRQVATDLGVADQVRFGSLEREELPAAYAAADVMVFPSEWAEPFGLVPVEAMACATPVLATRVGGSAEFLHDGVNCLAFTPRDSAGLAAAVRRLAGDEPLRQRLVEASRKTVEVLDVERLADVMEAWHVYEADGRPGPPPARRPGVTVPSGPSVALRLVGDGGAVVEAAGRPAGGVQVEPARLPVRSGALRSIRLRTDGLALDAGLDVVIAEAARTVGPGGVMVVEGPNPRDLRALRSRARAWWRGWRHRPAVPAGAIGRRAAMDALGAHGTVMRSGTGTWDQTLLGRLAGALIRLTRRGDWGPRTQIEVRRR